MKVFEYEGLNKTREVHKGTIEAHSKEEAIEGLKLMGLFPTVLRERKDSAGGRTSGLQGRDGSGGNGRAAARG